MLSGTTSHRRVPGASETCLCSQSCSTGSSRFLDRICVGFLWHIQYTCMIMHALWHTPLTEKMRQWINEMFLTFSNETFIFFHCWIRRRLGSMLSTNLKLEATPENGYSIVWEEAEQLKCKNYCKCLVGTANLNGKDIMQHNQSLQHILNKPSPKILIR